MKLSKYYIVILLVVLSIGCREEDKYRLNFNHFLHVDDFEIECTFCHGEMAEGLFSAADMEVCVECHEEEVDADEVTRETCGKCHVEKDLDTIGEADHERPTRGVFRHSEALNGSCRICHENTLKEGVTKLIVWERSDVVEIRKKGHLMDLDCKACHENINAETPWETHDTNWITRHGMYAAEEEPLCTQCHEEENCRECHQRQKPSSHVNVWTWRTHGIEASWNRQNCQLCHQDDFCTACHTSTQPRSHNSQWRYVHGLSNDLDACQLCHQPDVCTTCHSVTKPRSHSSQWQYVHGLSNDLNVCQVCHQPDFCTYCHSVTQPRSHVAGWLSTLHCTNCHFSTSNCSVCHQRSTGEIHDAFALPIKQPFHSLLVNPTECLNAACHAPGGAEPLPANHFIFDESECTICHSP